MSFPSFSIIIPIFNEEKNIINLYKEIKNSLINIKILDYEIIFVNDCSNDGSKKTIEQILIKDNKIKLISNDTNSGQSFSLHQGIKFSRYSTIVIIDGDGQNVPSDISKLLEIYNQGKYKLIGGIRKIRKDSIIKILSSKIANYIRSIILNDGCKDSGCGLKVFDKKIFLEVPYFDGIHRFLPAIFQGFGYNTFFIEVKHRKRKFGKSKYGIFKRLLSGIINIIRVKKIVNAGRK